jgi:hypothetical protein
VDVREDRAWLLRNRFSPFPVAGKISLVEGLITFTLDPSAADGSLTWLEEAMGTEGLAEKVRDGEPVTVFSLPLEDCEISWPITGGGAMMLIDAGPGGRWVVSHDYAVGGAVLQTLNVITGRNRARTWKKALAAAEARRGEAADGEG